MKVLFLHQNFPGQFKYLAPAMARRGDEVRALRLEGQDVPGVKVMQYKAPQGSTPKVHRWALEFEAKMIRADGCGRAMEAMKKDGFAPDLVIAHPGWGESLMVADLFPNARQLHFLEWYYHVHGADVGFDASIDGPEPVSPGQVRAKNAVNLLALEQMDLGYSPTHWQRSKIPEQFHSRIEVVHDGVNTDFLQPKPDATVHFERDGITLSRDDELVTFINRNLEPLRGWHVFARSLPRLMEERPNAHVAIIGGSGVSYGAPSSKNESWRAELMAEVGTTLDMERIHFLGLVPYMAMVQLLSASSCHVYLTMPFVLSWSMLEAMALGAIVVGSETPPVQEVIEHGKNGLLTPFHDADQLAETIIDVLAKPQDYEHLRAAARQTVIERYDLNSICLPRLLKLADRTAGLKRPAGEEHTPAAID